MLTYLRAGQVHPKHLYFLFGLTIVMWLAADFTHIPGILSHPQFTGQIDSDHLEHFIGQEHGLFFYKLFFFIDFIWAPVLLIAIWMYVKDKYYNQNPDNRKILFAIFTLIAFIALGFDYAENCMYLLKKEYPKKIAAYKMAAYGIVALSIVLVFLHYSFKNYLSVILRFLKASIYSLVILIVLGSFLPKATQVNSIVVNLYEHPLNLVILFLVAPTFAVVLAHYPSYFFINEKYRSWYMARIRWGLIGTIFYKYKKDFGASDEGKKEGQVNFLYRILGILFYVALFYMLGYTSEVNFNWTIQTSKLATILLACGILALYLQKKRKDSWFGNVASYLESRFPGFYDGDNPVVSSDDSEKGEPETNLCGAIEDKDPDNIRTDLLKIKKPVAQFILLFTFTVLLHVGLVVFFFLCKDCWYTELTSIWSLVCIVFQLFSYVFYRTFRSVLRFVFFKKKCSAILNSFYILWTIEEGKDCLNPGKNTNELSLHCKFKNILQFFQDFDPKPDLKGEKKESLVLNGGFYALLRYLGAGSLSNNITFLQFTVLVGIINAFFFLIINIYSELSLYFNPILIILSALFFYYGFLVVITKSLIYYRHSCEVFAIRNRQRFKFIIIASVVALVICNRLGRKFSNELFTLPLLERTTHNELTLEAYVDSLPENQTRYYIGCYGGGMKSNAWTMTVLKALYDKDNDFFKKTVGISGASGGTVGLANIAAVINANKDTLQWDNIITKISTENILSLDLTHILGRDTFNHLFVPGMELSGKDRSSKAMARYAKLTNNADEICKPTPYRQYWKKLYDKQHGQFPILISNSTNVKGNGGMAVSVGVENEVVRKLLYRNADDILEIYKTTYDRKGIAEKSDSLTLSFYDAVSTSNRFPLISPAAKIETKGHYSDGGIYENSGLLSVLKLFNAISFKEAVQSVKDLKQRNVFVSIVNDKNAYIKKTVNDALGAIRTSKINKSTEISSILNSVAATEMFPKYVKSELERLEKLDCSGLEFHTIYLPHRFDVADIKSIYGDELDNGSGINATNKLFYHLAKTNDEEIKKLLDRKCGFGDKIIIEPPMSRVMASEAYEFMRKMIGHDLTKGALENVYDKE